MAEVQERGAGVGRLSAFHPLQAPREPAPENAWSRDAVITLVFALFAYVTSAPFNLWAGFVSVLIALPLVFRRHYPMLMLYGSTLGALVQLLLPDIQASVVVVPFVVYNVARWVAPPSAARLSVIVGLVGAVLGPVRWTTTESYYGGPSLLGVYAFACLVCVLAAYVFGRRRHESIRSFDERRQAEETTLRMQLAASEQRARAAEVNERNRIARELHDIVAHSLSVIVVQAEGGRALAAKKPELAGDVLDTIAETSRDALTEMRRIVGVLRHGPDAPPDWKPAPGLGDLADLVQRTSDRATLEVRGPLPQVSQTVGLTVYRVAQEALTNMLKHAGPDARGRVLLDCTQPSSVELVVRDDGVGGRAGSDGRGHGLRGMHERVQLVGGRVRTGPHPGGGFEVRARFPLGPSRPAPGHHSPGHPSPGHTAPGPRPPVGGLPTAAGPGGPQPGTASAPARPRPQAGGPVPVVRPGPAAPAASRTGWRAVDRERAGSAAPVPAGETEPGAEHRPRRPGPVVEEHADELPRYPRPTTAPPGRPGRPAADQQRGTGETADELTVSLDAQPTVRMDPDHTETSVLPRTPGDDETRRADRGRHQPPRSRP